MDRNADMAIDADELGPDGSCKFEGAEVGCSARPRDRLRALVFARATSVITIRRAPV